jgi:hypothetical protein
MRKASKIKSEKSDLEGKIITPRKSQKDTLQDFREKAEKNLQQQYDEIEYASYSNEELIDFLDDNQKKILQNLKALEKNKTFAPSTAASTKKMMKDAENIRNDMSLTKKVIDKFANVADKLKEDPRLKKLMSEDIGALLDGIKNKNKAVITDDSRKALVEFENALKIEEAVLKKYDNIVGRRENIFDTLRSSVRQTIDDFKFILKNPYLAAGIFGAVAGEQAVTIAKSANSMRKDFGLTFTQTAGMAKNLAGAAFSGAALGIGFEATAEAAKAIIHHNANLLHSTASQIKQVAYMADRYGMSAENAAHLLEVTQQLSNYNKENAKSLVKSYVAIAAAYNVTTGAVAADMAQNAEFFALHTKNSGMNIATASAAMQSLGMNLSDVSSISEKLLDIEGSINAEMQASVFLGKNLNLTRARELAFAGDYDKMLQEIGKQLPTMNEWENLNYVQRKKVAEAYGLQADKMFQMIGEQQNINKLTKQESNIWGTIAAGLNNVVGLVKNYGTLMGSALNFTGAILNNWTGIGKGISGTVGKLKDAGGWLKKIGGMGLDKLTGLFGGGSEIAKTVTSTATNVGSGLVGDLADKTKDKLLDKGIDTASGGFEKKLKSGLVLKKAGTSMNAPTKEIANAGKNMGAIMKGAAAVAIVAGAIYILAQAVKVADGVGLETYGKLGLGLLGLMGAAALAGKIGQGAIDGAFAMTIIGAALIPFSFGLSLLKDIKPEVINGAMKAILALTLATVAIGAVMVAGGELAILAGAGAFAIMGASLIPLAYALSLMAPGMIIISQLSNPAIYGGLFQAASAITSLAGSLALLAGSLLLLTPLLPVLMAVSSLSSIGDAIGGGSESKGKSNDDMKQMADDISAIKDYLANGMNVYLDGRKVSNSLGIAISQVKAISNNNR